MEMAKMDNDTRGWIMCIVSGIACIAGACVICVDLVVRYIPGKANFKIQESSVFLACSLSLSFGVMIFSALFSMLPSSKKYLKQGGYHEQQAGLIMMSCFIGGFIGIQGLSRVLHRLIPSHVVDCDHSHDHAVVDDHDHDHGHHHSAASSRHHSRASRSRLSRNVSSQAFGITTLAEEHGTGNGSATESTPLLRSEADQNGGPYPDSHQTGTTARSNGLPLNHGHNHTGHSHGPSSKPFGNLISSQSRRPSMMEVRNRVMSFVKDTKNTCDADGPCYGYGDPCGQECFKHIGSVSVLPRRSTSLAKISTSHFQAKPLFTRQPESDEDDDSDVDSCPSPSNYIQSSRVPSRAMYDEEQLPLELANQDLEAQEAHHHHVPTNAFMSIGLQTVVAIALHKFPEGFITYASNHTNPDLGFNVFMALFVHNIAEGFTMALPLYMALGGSRIKAIMWTTLLGGLSQPTGAAIAWLLFKISRRSRFVITDIAYACLFGITAGIMTSVALQLFVESLSLNHNRNLSIAFAFLGMILLGVSSAIGHH